MSLQLKSTYFLLILILILQSCTPTHLKNLDKKRALNASMDLADFQNSVPTPCEDKHLVLSLDEIIEIAIRNNLDIAVKEQQYAIQRLITLRTSLNMLPDFLINTNMSVRDNSPAAASKLYRPPGSPIVPPAVSSPRRTFQSNFGAVWNLIDFGISYYKARQEADRTTIAFFEYERAKQNVILQVVQSYWRAVSSKYAVDSAIPLVSELVEKRNFLEAEIKDGDYLSELDAYSLLGRYYQREIQLKGFNDRTDSSDPTQGYEKEYQNAIQQLASLMRMPPDTKFDIEYDVDWSDDPGLWDMKELEITAILNRPELYSQDIQELITYDDVSQAIIHQFPSLQLSLQKFYDANHFLVNNNWLNAGVNIAWNLMNVPKYYEEAMIGNYKGELSRRLRMQLSMGILVQVNIAGILYEQNKEQYLLARNNSNINDKISDIMVRQSFYGKKSEADELSTRIDAVLARINAIKVYAEMQSSLEMLNNAIGMPRYFKTNQDRKE